MTVVPTNGRDYKTAKAAKADWYGEKDFMICDMSSPDDGRHINITCTPKGMRIGIRYKRLTMQTFLTT